MGVATQDAIKQLSALMDELEEPLKRTFQNVHQGYQNETLARFLRAREGIVSKAHKMLMDCLNWRISSEIDSILSKPIVPVDLYRSVRESQLIGMSGYTKEDEILRCTIKGRIKVLVISGICLPNLSHIRARLQVLDGAGLPVFALGVGLSTFDKASVHYYMQSHIQINEYRDRVVLPEACKKHGKKIVTCLKVLDMTGLKLSALSQIKLLTMISTIDDLNYPEKTETYYIVNVPYIFSACWKVVKPLLQERTRKKIKVLSGNGREELLQIMDYHSLPHFCKRDGSGSGSGSTRYELSDNRNCFSLDHPFHQELYNFIKQQASIVNPIGPIKHGSFHVEMPEPDAEGNLIAKTIESEMHKFGDVNGMSRSVSGLKILDN